MKHSGELMRVGIVGAGFGRYTIAPAFRRDPRCEVAAICARSTASLERASRELGVDQLFTDVTEMLDAGLIDIVAIATPPADQPRYAEAALERGLPVFAEKLLAMTADDAHELEAVAQRRGLPTAVDFIFPELDTWRAAHRAIQEGAIGTLRHVTVTWLMQSYDNRHGMATWKTDDVVGGGVLQHFGAHTFHYIEWLMGPIVTLSATLGRATDIQRPGDTTVSVTLRFASGATGSVSLSNASPDGSGHRVEINGSAGTLVLSNPTPAPVVGFDLRVVAGEKLLRHVIEPVAVRDGDERIAPVARIASRFLDAIRDGCPMAPSFKEGARVVTLLDAIRLSDASSASVIVATP